MKIRDLALAALLLASGPALAEPIALLKGPLDPSNTLATLNTLIPQINAAILSGAGAGSGTVTSVGLSVPAGILGVTGSPVTDAGAFSLTTSGTSGGIPYFSSATTIGTSAALTSGLPVIGGGAGTAPSSGTRSGTTTKYVSMDASTPSTNDCAKFDASGNLTTAGAACGSGGGSIAITDGIVTVDPAITMSLSKGMAVVDLGGGTAQISLTAATNPQAGATYTIQTTDAEQEVLMTNGSATTVTLPSGATAGSGFGFGITCQAGCTIGRAGSDTINGATSLVLGVNESAWFRGTGASPTPWRAAVTTPLDPLNADNMVLGTLAVARGGTGLASGTSGGIPAYTASGTIASSAALTAGMPVIGGGAGAVPTVGTRSGNSAAFVTTTGTQTSGRCVEIDANGNHVAAAGACGSSTGITAAFAAIGWVAATNPNKAVIMTATTGMTVTDIRGTVADAVGAAAALTVYKAPSGTVCTSGTAQHTGTFDANGTAATNQTLSLAGGGANTLSAGDRLCLGTSDGAAFTAGVGNGGLTVTYTVP